MTDFIYPSVSWRWIIPGIIAAGLWAGHHQPEPVACEPGSSLYAPTQTYIRATDLRDKNAPGYKALVVRPAADREPTYF